MTAQVKPRRRLIDNQTKWFLIFISPWLVGFVLFYALPIIASFGFSLFDFNLVNPEQAKYVGFANWQRALFEDPQVPQAFLVTFKFAFVSLPVGLIFAMAVALVLNSPRLWGKNLFRTLFYMPTVFPFVAAVLIWAGILNEQSGWINLFLKNIGLEGVRWLADPSVIYFTYTLLGIWAIGNTILITLAGLQNVPTVLYEAAEIDGAGYWPRMFNVTLPIISPVIFYNLVLGVIGLMQYFLQPFVMNGGSGYPDGSTRFIMIYFYKQAFNFFNMGYGATLAWLIFLVGVILAGALFSTANRWVYYAGE
jgi:multiple sugar transport system permease protein